ncbi:stealth family protein [Enterobacter hormaechei]
MSLRRKTRKLFKNPSLFFSDFMLNRNIELKNIKNNISNAEELSTSSAEASKPKPKPKPKETKATKSSKKIFSRIANGNIGDTFYARLTECCKNMNIPFMTGATPDQWMHGIHINKDDILIFSKLLEFWFSGNDKYFIRYKNNTYPLKEALLKKEFYAQETFDILCVENEFKDPRSHTECYFSSIISVMLWKKLDNYSSEIIYSICTKNKYIHRLRENTFNHYMQNNHRINDTNNVSDITFPIDVVYTWVDGSDVEWRAQKENYSAIKNGIRNEDTSQLNEINEDGNAGRAFSDERFRNRNELLYSLRSLELYAPFVRNIYIVTSGQRPEWLNDQSDKIKIIPHSEIYENKDHLPTFNSSGIETQLHHIPGLSEHFLYLNDDFMFADFCTPDDFFYPNGILKFFPSESRAYEDDIDDSREEYLVADRNAIHLLNEYCGKTSRMIMKHAPYPCSRSYLYELENKYKDTFLKCAENRFRDPTDIRPIAFMQYNFGYYDGKAIQSYISNRYLALYKDTIKEQLNGVFENRKFKTICINDVGLNDDKLESVNKITHDFLESYFPIKSSFEK